MSNLVVQVPDIASYPDLAELPLDGPLNERGLRDHRNRYSLRIPVERDATGAVTNKPSHINPDPNHPDGCFTDQKGVEWWALEYFRDSCWRMAWALSEPEFQFKREEYVHKFFWMLYNTEFVPNSPTWWAAGTEEGQLSACFVIGPEGFMPEDPDSLPAIQKLKNACETITHSGGGIGIHLGAIRPRGSPVRRGAHGSALGPVSVLRQISFACGELTQRGKREAAGMCILPVGHPDIVEFIRSKTQEGTVHNFNISVGATDAFMEAVIDNAEFPLTHPKWVASLNHFPEDARSAIRLDPTDKTLVWIRAQWLLDQIVKGAHRNGEPGLFFIDRANTEEWAQHGIHIYGTNPCVAEGTLVNTPSGYIPVEQIQVGDTISTVLGSEPVETIETHDDVPVFRVKFSDGGEQRVTAAHRYHVIRNGSISKQVQTVRVDELQVGDYVRVHASPIEDSGSATQYQFGLKQGIMLGDGCYTKPTVDRHDVVKIASNQDDVEYNANLRTLFGTTRALSASTNSKSVSIIVGGGAEVVEELGLAQVESPEKNFDILSVDSQMHALGLLDGLLATDGNVNLRSNHPQVRWDTTSPAMAQNIRRLLLMVGCHGRVTESFGTGGTIDGREIIRKHTKYTVTLSGDGLGKYAQMSRIHQLHPGKGEKLATIRREWMATGNTWKAAVTSIEPDGSARVYDLYCAKSDTWITDGYVQQGCGEQPLPNNGVCNLGHTNLARCILRDAEGTALGVDWAKLRRITWLGTRFLDDVIEVNAYPLPEIATMARKYRNIGGGVLGWHDMLLELGIRYGSKEANALACEIESFRRDEATRASQRLAKERGSPFGGDRRNLILLTIAPTGTTGGIAGVEGSGIEPIFGPGYWRKDHVHREGIFVASKYINSPAFSCAVSKWKDSPDGDAVYKPEYEVTVEEHVSTQAAFQSFNDSGISKTINLPNHATEQDIWNAFIMTWQAGGKGSTVYRDGSREVEVLSATKKEGVFDPQAALKSIERDTPLDGTFTVGVSDVIYTLEDLPDEARTRRLRLKYKGKKVYLFVVENNHGEPRELFVKTPGLFDQELPSLDALCRITSLALRAQVPVEKVIEQLEDSKGTISQDNYPQLLLAGLYGYAVDGATIEDDLVGDIRPSFSVETVAGETPTNSKFLCPACGAALAMQSGCFSCSAQCGYSKCG